MKNYLLLLLVPAGLFACRARKTALDEPEQTRQRTLAGFRAIAVQAPLAVTLTEGGPAFRVRMRGPESNLKAVRLTVRDSILTVSSVPDAAFDASAPLQIDLYAPRVDAVAVHDTASATLRGGIPHESLEVQLAGAGTVVLDGLAAKRLQASVNGAGLLQLRGGSVATASYDVYGAADVQARETPCRSVAVTLTGAGRVAVWATDRLDAVLTGTGVLRYKGNPRSVQRTVYGTGRLEAVP